MDILGNTKKLHVRNKSNSRSSITSNMPDIVLESSSCRAQENGTSRKHSVFFDNISLGLPDLQKLSFLKNVLLYFLKERPGQKILASIILAVLTGCFVNLEDNPTCLLGIAVICLALISTSISTLAYEYLLRYSSLNLVREDLKSDLPAMLAYWQIMQEEGKRMGRTNSGKERRVSLVPRELK